MEDNPNSGAECMRENMTHAVGHPDVLAEYLKVYEGVMDFKNTVKKILLEIGLASVCEPLSVNSDVETPLLNRTPTENLNQVQQLTLIIINTLGAVAEVIRNIFSGNAELPNLRQLSSGQREGLDQIQPKTEVSETSQDALFSMTPPAPSSGTINKDSAQGAAKTSHLSPASHRGDSEYVDSAGDRGHNSADSCSGSDDLQSQFDVSRQRRSENKTQRAVRRGRRSTAQMSSVRNRKKQVGVKNMESSIDQGMKRTRVRIQAKTPRQAVPGNVSQADKISEIATENDEKKSAQENDTEDETHSDSSENQDHSSRLALLRGKRKRVHQRTRTQPSKIIRCDFCPLSFQKRREFGIHMRRNHPEQTQHKCDQCEKVLTSLSALRNHMRSHSERQSYKCSQCEAAFKTYRELKGHTVRIHNGVKDHLCSWCGKEFAVACALTAHIRLVHVREKPHHCEECGARFLYPSRLAEHRNTVHSKQLQFACEFCGSRFFYEYQLKKHKKRYHSDGPVERPHKCDQCPQAFFSPSELKVHRRVHTKERPFRCPTCGAGFAGSNGYNRHLRIHSGVKNQTCPICGKAFRDSWTLKNHTQTVHSGEKPYQCEFCQVKFAHRNSYTSHMKKHKLASEPDAGPEKKGRLNTLAASDISTAVLQIPLS